MWLPLCNFIADEAVSIDALTGISQLEGLQMTMDPDRHCTERKFYKKEARVILQL